MKTKCGRCRGRGYVRELHGLKSQVCPSCEGQGVRERKSTLGSKTVSVPVNGAACKECGDPAVHSHHVCSQQRIKRFLGADARPAQADPRNTIPLCFRCHERIESGAAKVEPHQLHRGFWAFVREYGLEPAVPQHLAERMPA